MDMRYKALRYFAYSLEILIIYVLQGIPNFLPELFGSKPCMLIAAAVTIAVFENEIAAMIFGAVCGILTDFGFNNSMGYYAILLAVLCFFIGYFCDNYIIVNLLNSVIIGLIVIVVVIGLNFVLFYIMPGKANPTEFFVSHYISRMAYTFAFLPILYYLNRLLYRRVNERI